MKTKKIVFEFISKILFQRIVALIVLLSLPFLSFGQLVNEAQLFSFENNPANEYELTSFPSAKKYQEVLVVVYDIMGKENFSKVIITENAGESIYVLDPSGKLGLGIYQIIATSMKKTCYKKLVVSTF